MLRIEPVVLLLYGVGLELHPQRWTMENGLEG